MSHGPRRLSAHRLALALALVAAAPPLVIHNGWPGLLVAVAGVLYAAYLLVGKRLPRRRPERPLAAVAGRLGERLAADGFEQDRYVFRRYNEAGDALIVDLQPLRPGTRFAVRAGFVLAPYWEWEKQALGYPADKRPDMSLVNWARQVTPSEAAEWVISGDAASVAERIHQRLPDLGLWLDRDLLWRAAGGGTTELGHISEPIRLWLLVERGQSEELRELLDVDGADREIWEFAKRQAE